MIHLYFGFVDVLRCFPRRQINVLRPMVVVVVVVVVVVMVIKYAEVDFEADGVTTRVLTLFH
jgi:hypothetical protein